MIKCTEARTEHYCDACGRKLHLDADYIELKMVVKANTMEKFDKVPQYGSESWELCNECFPYIRKLINRRVDKIRQETKRKNESK